MIIIKSREVYKILLLLQKYQSIVYNAFHIKNKYKIKYISIHFHIKINFIMAVKVVSWIENSNKF